MTTVTIHEAKTRLSCLIARALSGEEVVVTRGREPVVTLKPIASKTVKRRIGGIRGLIRRMPKDFNAPLPDFKDYMS